MAEQVVQRNQGEEFVDAFARFIDGAGRGWYDKKPQIEQVVQDLGGLNNLINWRHDAGYKSGERLREYIVDGRIALDSCGNAGRVFIGWGHGDPAPKDLYPDIPRVLTFGEFSEFLKTKMGEEKANWGRTMGHSLPPSNVQCPCCRKTWTIDDYHKVAMVRDTEVLSLSDFVGQPFGAVKQYLKERTDGVFFVQPDLPLRNDRYIDLTPDPKYPEMKVNEKGWLRALPRPDYVVEAGDETLVNVWRYYHPSCYAKALSDKVKTAFESNLQKLNEGKAEEVGTGNGNMNLAGLPREVATAVCQQELAQAGVRAIPRTPKGEVQSEVKGLIQYGDGTEVYFVRAWYYWMVGSTKALPYEAAKKLNDAFGSDVRVEGYAGGKDVRPEGTFSWHVDTDLGLRKLVEALDEQFGQHVIITKRKASPRTMAEVAEDSAKIGKPAKQIVIREGNSVKYALAYPETL